MDFAESGKPSDEKLIEDCINRDKRAWDAFVEKYSKLVLWAIRERLARFRYAFDGDDVEDIHQEVFASIWSQDKLARLRDKERIANWLAMVAGNAAIDYFKKMRRQMPPNAISIFEEGDDVGEGKEGVLLFSQSEDPAAQAHLNEIRALLESAIGGLLPRERTVLTLNLIYGRKYREISEMLGMPLNTVATIVSRTKEELKGKLRSKGIEDF